LEVFGLKYNGAVEPNDEPNERPEQLREEGTKEECSLLMSILVE